MLFSRPFPNAFGLDIGDLSIKLVYLERKPGWRNRNQLRAKTVRSVVLPPGYIVDGELLQPEMIRKKLLHLLGKEDGKKVIHSPWVVASLPEPKSFLQLIKIDVPPTDLTAEDVEFQAAKNLPYQTDEIHLDYQVVNENPADTFSKVLISAMPKTFADSYTYLLESAGLTPIALEPESIALARSMITANKTYHGEARAILDIGSSRSTLIVYDHNCVQFSACLKFSGELLTMAITQKLGVERDEAEKLKKQNGLAYDSHRPGYLKAITDQTDTLIEEIKKTVAFYKNHFPTPNPVTHITLCGGGANLKGLGSTIARQLKITASTGHPWKNLGAAFSEQENIAALPLATAIGLGLRAVNGF